MRRGWIAVAFTVVTASQGFAQAAPIGGREGDFVAANFRFNSGETLAKLTLHYMTLGHPIRDAAGRVSNAVMILHGTTGTGRQFLSPGFAGVLFGPGQLLDTSRYYVILPDGIGHGKSSKPSDGMRMRFPHYDYADMIAAQHLMLVDGLKVDHLRLVLGTSMGCMHAWMWGETYPDFVDALMPLACLPVPIAGRNRMMRDMIMDAIRQDPSWDDGAYTTPPQGMKTALDILMIMTSSPMQMQKTYPTRDGADSAYHAYIATRFPTTDANDFLYAFDASRTYDPSAKLGEIRAPVMAVNSADDQVNPPELGVMEVQIKKVPKGKYVLIPTSDQTRGHGTHTLAAVWKSWLQELLAESEKR
jgi:homoserine O-acetyltransferase